MPSSNSAVFSGTRWSHGALGCQQRLPTLCSEPTTLTRTEAVPEPIMPRDWAALRDTSTTRPRTYGPRSFRRGDRRAIEFGYAITGKAEKFDVGHLGLKYGPAGSILRPHRLRPKMIKAQSRLAVAPFSDRPPVWRQANTRDRSENRLPGNAVNITPADADIVQLACRKLSKLTNGRAVMPPIAIAAKKRINFGSHDRHSLSRGCRLSASIGI